MSSPPPQVANFTPLPHFLSPAGVPGTPSPQFSPQSLLFVSPILLTAGVFRSPFRPGPPPPPIFPLSHLPPFSPQLPGAFPYPLPRFPLSFTSPRFKPTPPPSIPDHLAPHSVPPIPPIPAFPPKPRSSQVYQRRSICPLVLPPPFPPPAPVSPRPRSPTPSPRSPACLPPRFFPQQPPPQVIVCPHSPPFSSELRSPPPCFHLPPTFPGPRSPKLQVFLLPASTCPPPAFPSAPFHPNPHPHPQGRPFPARRPPACPPAVPQPGSQVLSSPPRPRPPRVPARARRHVTGSS